MKFNLLKNKKIIVTVLVIVALAYIYIDSQRISRSLDEFDKGSAKIIEVCIASYIADSNDYDLKFGGNKSILDVNELLEKLTLEFSFEGKKYGPYILKITDNIRVPPSSTSKNSYKGWKIVIDKNNEPKNAVSVKHYKYNVIEFIEKNDL